MGDIITKEKGQKNYRLLGWAKGQSYIIGQIGEKRGSDYEVMPLLDYPGKIFKMKIEDQLKKFKSDLCHKRHGFKKFSY